VFQQSFFNLVGAAMTIPLAIATGLGAWRWQLEGARLKGNLQLHLICALTMERSFFCFVGDASRLGQRATRRAPVILR